MEQVAVGIVASAPVALLWYLVVDPLSRKLFPLLRSSWLNNKLLLIRDTSDIPDVILFEYKNVEALQGRKVR